MKITSLLDTSEARLYETIAKNDYSKPEDFLLDNLNDAYKGKAILSSAISFRANGQLLDAGKLLREASTLSSKYKDIVTMYQIQKELAVIFSLNGDHNGALEVLESAMPLAKAILKSRPAYYFDYLNSRAVELGDLGRLEEAWGLCRIALASPFSGRYISWHETRVELNEKRGHHASRSVVAGSKLDRFKNVQALPILNTADLVPGIKNENPAKVFEMAKWARTGMKDKQTNKNQMMINLLKKNQRDSLKTLPPIRRRL
ncbi:MAG: hypothetical protein WBV94_28765 [Blastocatellia bacterium]